MRRRLSSRVSEVHAAQPPVMPRKPKVRRRRRGGCFAVFCWRAARRYKRFAIDARRHSAACAGCASVLSAARRKDLLSFHCRHRAASRSPPLLPNDSSSLFSRRYCRCVAQPTPRTPEATRACKRRRLFRRHAAIFSRRECHAEPLDVSAISFSILPIILRVTVFPRVKIRSALSRSEHRLISFFSYKDASLRFVETSVCYRRFPVSPLFQSISRRARLIAVRFHFF